jgi:hypothetical protein
MAQPSAEMLRTVQRITDPPNETKAGAFTSVRGNLRRSSILNDLGIEKASITAKVKEGLKSADRSKNALGGASNVAWSVRRGEHAIESSGRDQTLGRDAVSPRIRHQIGWPVPAHLHLCDAPAQQSRCESQVPDKTPSQPSLGR